jgi:hypothetical protein
MQGEGSQQSFIFSAIAALIGGLIIFAIRGHGLQNLDPASKNST